MSTEENHLVPKPPPSLRNSAIHIKTINISNIPFNLLNTYFVNNLSISTLKLKNILIVDKFNIKSNFLRIQTSNINSNLSMFKYNNIDEVNTLLITIYKVLRNLHAINIPHLNFKPSNILISSSNEIYVSDYSINSIRNSNNIPFTSIQYFSPEQLLNRETSYESDIWSFGCIIYYIITKKPLLEGTKIEELKSKLLNIKLESNNKDSLLSKYEYLLKLMLRIKPQNRISINEVYEELRNITTTNNHDDDNSLLLNEKNCILYISNKDLCENEYSIINSNNMIINKLVKECNNNNYDQFYIYILINSLLYSKQWDELKCYCYDKLNNNYYKLLSMGVYKQFGICLRCFSNLNNGYIIDFVNHLHFFKCITYLDLLRNEIYKNNELMSNLYDKLSFLTNLKRLKLESFLSFKFPATLKYLDLLIYSIEPGNFRLDLSNQGLNGEEINYIYKLINDSNRSITVIVYKGKN